MSTFSCSHPFNIFTLLRILMRLCWRPGAPEAMRPVEALLEVAAFPDDGIAAMSFNFWHRLARYLSSGFSPQSLEDASSTEVWGRFAARLLVIQAVSFHLERLPGARCGSK